MADKNLLRSSFVKTERLFNSVYFKMHEPDAAGYCGSQYRLHPENAIRNLAPSIRDLIPAHFREKSIQWHTHANHGLSSQVCCLNFLAPLAQKPEALGCLVQSVLGGEMPTMLPVETGPNGDWYVGFEWIGGDYLNEAGKSGTRSRGANATSADAVLMCIRNGKRETLLIEWKYTEYYGSPINPTGNETRLRRYNQLAIEPHGPIRSDLGLSVKDFFWEPFYQLLRQQMLAFQMEHAREDGADIVRIIHLSPAQNLPLKFVTAPNLRTFGSDFTAVWQHVIRQPDRFLGVDIGHAFAPLLENHCDCAEWTDYIRARYPNLILQSSQAEIISV